MPDFIIRLKRPFAGQASEFKVTAADAAEAQQIVEEQGFRDFTVTPRSEDRPKAPGIDFHAPQSPDSN